MKQIKLSRGLVALVDDKDYDRLSEYSWNATVCSNGAVYAARTVRLGAKKKNIRMHRVILGIVSPKVEVDHKDGNTLNNQRRNLRLCSHKQNMANMKKRRTRSTSQFKGVSLHKHSGLWRATIRFTHLGYFKTEKEAAQAYNSAAGHVFGVHARVNVIP